MYSSTTKHVGVRAVLISFLVFQGLQWMGQGGSLLLLPEPALAVHNGIPVCNSLHATIFVKPNGKIYGGPGSQSGSTFDGTLLGNNTGAQDVIVGTSGNDIINGQNGDDIICGGDGRDTINGGNGKDELFGEGGDDVIRGGTGGDSIDGGLGYDFCNGDQGPVFVNCESTTGQGIVKIFKEAVPSDAQDFAFTGGLGAFSLDDDSSPPLSNSGAFTKAISGSLIVIESVTPGWSLTEINCTDPDGGTTTNLGQRRATIDLDEAEVVSCTFTNTQQAQQCGNGIVEGTEACDDGNGVDTDACDNDCTVNICADTTDNDGDTFIDAADPGCYIEDNVTGTYDPKDSSELNTPRCGNGQDDQESEQCDDGNSSNEDACINACLNAVCGDSFTRTGLEQCDDGNAVNDDGCSNACTLPVCGDDILQSGEQCDDGNTASGDGCTAACIIEFCGDGVDNNGNAEECDTAGESSTCDANCSLVSCGDGTKNIAAGEQCDDGNMVNDDGCSSICQIEVCGDGIKQANEACDDGNQSNADACTNTCALTFCGDSIPQNPNGNGQSEQCDDGNAANGDGCSSTCQSTTQCNDGVDNDLDGVTDSEDPGCASTEDNDESDGTTQCQDGIDNADGEDVLSDNTDPGCHTDGDATNSGSYLKTDNDEGNNPFCSNGGLEVGEQCDDGNLTNGDGCDNLCHIEVCGNGLIQTGEECDDSDTDSGDGCSNICDLENGYQCTGEPSICAPICGDNLVIPPEVCDDGNTLNGDYCSADCSQITGICGDGQKQDNEACDDGNQLNGDYCSSTCQEVTGFCGDSTTQTNEQCDDGNQSSADACTPACTLTFCGDFIPQSLNGNGQSEQCDDGNTNNGDGCSNICQIEPGTIIVMKQTIGGDDTFGFQGPSSSYDMITSAGSAQTSFVLAPGQYSVSESTIPSGWDLTSATCSDGSDPGSIQLASNETVTCTFTNTKRGHIIIDKVTDPAADPQSFSFDATGGSYQDFSLTDTDAPNDQELVPGVYGISETVPAGWQLSSAFCSDQSDPSAINLSAGETVTCIFTNSEKPTLTVTKIVTNNNGGTKAVADFPLFIDATGVPSGVAQEVTVGAHTVSETGQAGYTGTIGGDCAANGNVTLAFGDHKNCTITNDDQPGTLIVRKVVVNDNGGTLAPQNFSFQVDGGSATSFEADGQNDLAVNAGTYDVTEPGVAGYATTYDNCTDVVISNGGTATCTITNDDITARLTVIKTVENNNGGTLTVADFPLFVSGSPVTSGVTNPFNAGPYAVSETSQPGYAAGAWGGDCAPDGSITLALGDNKTCTITNDDQPGSLTLVKTVTNNNGGTKVVSDFPLFVDGNPATSGVAVPVNAGAHNASETTQAGYAASAWGGDCAASGSVAVGLGEQKTCTITNNDIQPQLIVEKVVINDHGGSKIISDFPLFVDGGPVTSGAATSFDAGAHTVTETNQAGYAPSFSGDCDANGNVTLTVGDSVKTCTITNNDVQPRLTLTKVVTNDNGGTKIVSDFPLFIDGTPVTSGVVNAVNAGPHTASETAQPGYTPTAWSGDCAADGSITLNPGDVKSCTITNDDQAGTLIVKKVVINDNGGTLAAENFSFQVNGGSVTSFEADGQNDLTVSAGTYDITEPPVAGYTTTYENCDDVIIPNGGSATCTITNDDITPRLTIIKTVVNDNGGTKVVSDFPLFVDGSPVVSGVTNPFNAGPHTASETAQTGYAASVWGGDCAADGSVTLALADNKTCTITNNDVQPQLIVQKVVVNDHGGTKVIADFPLFVDGGSVTSGAANGFNAGAHVITETGQTGYTGTFSGDCDANGNVTLAVGDPVKTCTITNDDVQPQLTVTKIVTNDNGGTKVVADFPLFIDATGVTSGVSNGINAGAHTVSETGQTGYTGVISGDCAADGSITLNPGDVKSCTITNNDVQPQLTVTKIVTNNNGGTKVIADFPLFIDATGVTSGVVNGVNAGAHTVSETSQAGYIGTISGDCAADGSITLNPGDVKSCTITNDDQQGSLTLVKTVTNDHGGTKVVADFPLFIDGNPATSGVAVAVNAGAHTVSETSQTGYAAGPWGGDCAANGSVTLGPGENKTCTITNDDVQPQLTVTKVVVNDNGGTKVVADFPLFIDATGVTSGVANGVNAGPHTVSETNQAGYTAVISGDCAADGSITLNPGDVKSCTITNNDVQPRLIVQKVVTNDNGGTKVIADFPLFVDGNPVTSGQENSFNAGSHTVSETNQTGYAATFSGDCSGSGEVILTVGGATKICTITNNDIQPKLTVIKVVINDDGGVKQVSDFALFIDGNPTTSGTQTGLSAGPHQVSETSSVGYAATFSGDCNATGYVTLALGEQKTCTITNNDIAPVCNEQLATIYVKNDRVVGGPDNGRTYYGRLRGTRGNDVMVGTPGKDDFDGDNGNDIQCGQGGNDQLDGDSGEDKLFGGDGDDRLRGGNGIDLLDGGAGKDNLDGDNADDTLIGGPGNDKLEGDNGVDVMCGGSGNDTLKGENGPDQMDGGADTDTLNGGSASDQCANGETNMSCEQPVAAIAACAGL